jgi:hypothetical protein
MKNIIFIFAVGIILMACEKTISIKIPDEGRKLTINSFFAEDSNMVVKLTKSRYILDGKWEFDPVENADISLFENDVLLEKLSENNAGTYLSNIIIKANKHYKIEVRSNGFPDSKAESHVPERTDIITLTAEETTDEYGGPIVSFNLTFKDDPETENYYFVQGHKYYSDTYYDHDTGEKITNINKEILYLYSDDLNTYQDDWGLGEGVLMSDEFINGKEYKLNCKSYASYYYYDESQGDQIEPDKNDTTTYYIEFHSVSKEFYQYYKSLSKHKEATDEFFTEPVQVYNNIENGFGIFAGMSTDLDSVVIISAPLKNQQSIELKKQLNETSIVKALPPKGMIILDVPCDK